MKKMGKNFIVMPLARPVMMSLKAIIAATYETSKHGQRDLAISLFLSLTQLAELYIKSMPSSTSPT